MDSKSRTVTLCFQAAGSTSSSKSPRAARAPRGLPSDMARYEDTMGARDAELDPPFTPALWLLLWVTLAAGFVEAYAVMGSYTFQSLPATSEFFFPKPDAQPGSGIWSVPSSPADQQQQQQQLPLQGLTTPRLVPTGIVNVVPSANTTAQRADLLVDTEEAARRAHQLYCTWTKPGPLSLIPQLTPILAALLAAVISSRFGRRACIWAGTLLAVAAQVILASSQWYWMFMVGFGCAYGASAVLHTSLVLEDAEISPPRFRGSFMAANMFGQSVGWLTAAMLAVVLADKGQWGWRTLYGLGALPGVLLLLVLPWLPETPNSLLLRGKVEEGRLALKTIRGPFYAVGKELADIVAAAGPNPTLGTQLRVLFSRGQRAPLLMMLILLLAQELNGRQVLERFVNSLASVLSSKTVALGLSRYIILAASQMLGAIMAGVFSDRIGRRAMLAGCSMLAALCFAGMAVLLSHWLPHLQMQFTPAVAALVVMSSLVEACAAAAWLSTYSALTAELHCLRTRAVAVALTVAGMWVLTYLRFWARAPMLCAMRWGVLVFFAAANVVNALVAILLLPETKQLPLERIRDVWAHHWLWKRLAPAGTAPAGSCATEITASSGMSASSERRQGRNSSSDGGSALPGSGTAASVPSAVGQAVLGCRECVSAVDLMKHECDAARQASTASSGRSNSLPWFAAVHGLRRMVLGISDDRVQGSGPSVTAIQIADEH